MLYEGRGAIMKVKIFNVTPELEKVCSAAARMSTTEGTCTDVYEGIPDIENARKTLSRIVRLGHVSVLEHAYFNIMFENVSLFFEQFLIEHRISAYTIKSGRYVNFKKAGCYEPEFRLENFNENSEQNKLSKDSSVTVAKKKYLEFVAKTFKVYEELVNEGVKVEDARFILPYSLKTNIYCSMNARELVHLIWAILYGRGKGYPELIEIGTELRKQLKEIAPSIEENIEKIERGEETKEQELNNLIGGPTFKMGTDKSDKPLIEIIDVTESPEETIAISAIIKNKQCSIKEAKKMLNKDLELTDKIIDIIFKDKRKRELEQINITFKMNSVPLIILKHHVRHRLQSINIPSFTEIENTTEYTYPPSIMEKGKENVLKEIYQEANELHKEFVDLGICKEDLVYLYLHGKNIDVITTMNARTLYHICNLRTCNRAQWSIREHYMEIVKLLREQHPKIFKRFGPNCFTKGYCPEGKMTCGYIKEVKEYFTM